jgi:plastocyanin
MEVHHVERQVVCGIGDRAADGGMRRRRWRLDAVSISDFQFSPKDITINSGDTVVWTQTSTDPAHTVTATNGLFDSGAIFTSVGKTFSQTFTGNGVTINYYCKAHYSCCGMAGSIKVGSNAPPANPGY